MGLVLRDRTYSVSELLPAVRSLLRDLDFLDVRQQLAVLRAVHGLQRARGVIHAGDDVHGRGLPPVGQDSALLDVPASALLLPRPLAEAAVRIEDP